MIHYYLFEGATKIIETAMIIPKGGKRTDWLNMLQTNGRRFNTTPELEKHLNKKGLYDGDEIFINRDFLIAAVHPYTEINES